MVVLREGSGPWRRREGGAGPENSGGWWGRVRSRCRGGGENAGLERRIHTDGGIASCPSENRSVLVHAVPTSPGRDPESDGYALEALGISDDQVANEAKGPETGCADAIPERGTDGVMEAPEQGAACGPERVRAGAEGDSPGLGGFAYGPRVPESLTSPWLFRSPGTLCQALPFPGGHGLSQSHAHALTACSFSFLS
jgi:hypothetical protein